MPRPPAHERHYGALQGMNQAQTRQQFGDEQFMVWRQSYNNKTRTLPRAKTQERCQDHTGQAAAMLAAAAKARTAAPEPPVHAKQRPGTALPAPLLRERGQCPRPISAKDAGRDHLHIIGCFLMSHIFRRTPMATESALGIPERL